MLPRRRANKRKPLFCGRGGATGSKWSLRHDRVGRCRKVKSEGEKGRERVVGKSGGGRVRLYTWRSAGLADEVGFVLDTAGDEGGHGGH